MAIRQSTIVGATESFARVPLTRVCVRAPARHGTQGGSVAISEKNAAVEFCSLYVLHMLLDSTVLLLHVQQLLSTLHATVLLHVYCIYFTVYLWRGIGDQNLSRTLHSAKYYSKKIPINT